MGNGAESITTAQKHSKFIEKLATTFKGTVQRDFFTPVFFIIRLLLVPLDMPRSDFEFVRIFVEIFVFEIDSPLAMTVGSQKLSLRQPIVLTLFSW